MPNDPCGLWQEKLERNPVLQVHVAMLWAILQEFAPEQRDPIVRREMTRMFKQSIWAVTEVKVSFKHDLRYVSAGVVAACEVHGPLRSWMRGRKPGAPKLNHEHVTTQKVLRQHLFQATDRRQVERILSSAEGCVVTVDEHEPLKKAAGEGWTRYASAKIAVWDRATATWRPDCGNSAVSAKAGSSSK